MLTAFWSYQIHYVEYKIVQENLLKDSSAKFLVDQVVCWPEVSCGRTAWGNTSLSHVTGVIPLKCINVQYIYVQKMCGQPFRIKVRVLQNIRFSHRTRWAWYIRKRYLAKFVENKSNIELFLQKLQHRWQINQLNEKCTKEMWISFLPNVGDLKVTQNI